MSAKTETSAHLKTQTSASHQTHADATSESELAHRIRHRSNPETQTDGKCDPCEVVPKEPHTPQRPA
jgi:hypothetical protein